jgi:hypothetical protein
MSLLRVNPGNAWRMDLYMPFAIIYFFFNSVFLPLGLLYTTVLAPLFYFWLLRQGQRWVAAKFLLLSAPFMVIQFRNGVETTPYIVSLALTMAVYFGAYTFYVFVNWTERLEEFIQWMVVINFALTCIGMILYFTPWEEAMWRPAEAFVGKAVVSRFQMFTYEPSYYCQVIAPLILWSFFKFARRTEPRTLALFLMTLIPLLMSYSFGVILALVLAIAGVHAWNWRHVLKRYYMVVGAPLTAVVSVYILLGSNTFAARMQSFLAGNDSSGMARTVVAWVLAYYIALQKSLLFGVGYGQIKILGAVLTDRFIGSDQGRLPCAVAETLAQFGFIGLALRLGFQVYCFYKTQVWKNYFRLSLFMFMFVYQFTGSYLTNLPEYLTWILAFSPVFPEFAVESSRDRVMAWFVPRMRLQPPAIAPEPLH